MTQFHKYYIDLNLYKHVLRQGFSMYNFNILAACTTCKIFLWLYVVFGTLESNAFFVSCTLVFNDLCSIAIVNLGVGLKSKNFGIPTSIQYTFEYSGIFIKKHQPVSTKSEPFFVLHSFVF